MTIIKKNQALDYKQFNPTEDHEDTLQDFLTDNPHIKIIKIKIEGSENYGKGNIPNQLEFKF